MKIAAAIATMVLVFLLFSGCMETLFPRGLPTPGNASTSNSSASNISRNDSAAAKAAADEENAAIVSEILSRNVSSHSVSATITIRNPEKNQSPEYLVINATEQFAFPNYCLLYSSDAKSWGGCLINGSLLSCADSPEAAVLGLGPLVCKSASCANNSLCNATMLASVSPFALAKANSSLADSFGSQLGFPSPDPNSSEPSGSRPIAHAQADCLNSSGIELCLSHEGVILSANYSKEGDSFEAFDYNSSINASDILAPDGAVVLNETEFAQMQSNSAAFVKRSERTDSDFNLELLFFNVGMGDAALIRRGNFTMLIDAGPADNQKTQSLYSMLSKAGVYRLSAFALSSFDAAEDGGTQKTLSMVPSPIVLANNISDGSALSNSTLDFFLKSGMRVQSPQAGDAYRFGDIEFDFFLPLASRASGNPNLNTLAFALRRGGFCAFFAGQMEQESEPEVLSSLGNLSSCQILKVPQHGAGRPTPSLLNERLNPQNAIISVGNNSQGLPSDATLERLRLHGVGIYRTDLNGSIYVNVSSSGSYSITPNANLTQIGDYFYSLFPD